MEKRGSFFILLIIIAVLTLIIAVLAAFIVLVGVNGQAVAASGTGSEVVVDVEPPKESELSTVVLLESANPINLKNSENGRHNYALVAASVKYFNKVAGIKDVAAKIELEKANLQEIVTTYFMEMTVEEFANFETKARVKEELKQELNNFLTSTIPTAKDRSSAGGIIYDVVFSAWNYQAG